jgi:hypothetical protein
MAGSPETTVICTLGMHRSGTSLVSRMLNLLGVHLGPHQVVSRAGEDNPKGYWEHLPLALVNDEIMARFGGRWDEPPAFPVSWQRDPRLADLYGEARRLMTEDFAAAPLWGWKDPRTCLTLPFWQDLIGSMRYVICVRSPRAVMASLACRDGMKAEKAERLWLAHMQSGLAHTSGQFRIFVFYEDLIHDWAPELRRLAAFVGRSDSGEDPGVHASVGAFFEKELCHHRMSMEDLMGDERISFATKGLYLSVRAYSSNETPAEVLDGPERAGGGIQRSLDLLGTLALETWDRTVAAAAERDALVRENQAQAAAHDALVHENQAQAAAHDALVRESQIRAAERDALVRENQVRSAERDALVRESHAQAAERDALVRENQAQSASLDILRARCDRLAAEALALAEEVSIRDRDLVAARHALQEIHMSYAWKLVTFARRVMAVLMPAGTKRRRVFDAIVRRMTERIEIDPSAT